MTAPECRPPPGTPDGALLWIIDGGGWTVAEWAGRKLWFPGSSTPMTPASAYDEGYRFHSLATPPEEPK